MHLAALAIVAACLAADALGLGPPRSAAARVLVAAALGGQVAMVGAALWAQRRTLRAIHGRHGWSAVRQGDRLVRAARAGVIVLHVVACLAGWAALARAWSGTEILLDDLLAILPPVAALIAIWWAWAPVERRMAEWDLIVRLDEGRAEVRPPSRLAIVVEHVRSQLLLVLGPALLALALVETVRALLDGRVPGWVSDWAQGAAVVAVFLVSPAIVRRVLDTTPLPPGPVRTLLADVVRRNRVAVSELLVWRTGGSLRNAAVVGFLPALRYVLLTDALLGELTPRELAAVMAHEVAHVRHRHMLVGVLALMALSAAGGMAGHLALTAAAGGTLPAGLVDAVALAAAATVVVIGFGWTSRRLERQADASAAKDLGTDADGRITGEGVDAMCAALDAVAAPNGLDAARPSYRHGSIASRQAHLRELVGTPAGAVPVDRVVRRIAVASVVALAAAFAVDAVMAAAPIQSSLAAQERHPAASP